MDPVKEAIKQIENNNQVEILRQCQGMGERFMKLMELIPEMWL